MTDTKLTGLTETSAVEDDDLIYLVDVSDTTDSIDGSSRKAQAKNVRGYPRTAAEVTAAVTPTNYQYAPGNVLRYGTNTTPGTTDLATALNNAILVASQSGGAAYVPDEVVGIGSAITHKSNVALLGLGRQSTIKLLNNSDVSMISISSTSGASIRGIKLDGNAANQTTEDISAVAGNTVTDFVFSDNHVKDTNGRGIQIQHTSNRCSIRNNHFENIGGGTTDLGGAIESNGNSGTDNENIQIFGNLIEGTSQKGVSLVTTNNFIVSNNIINTSDRESLYIKTCDNGAVSNNRGEQDGVAAQDIGVTVSACNLITVNGNYFVSGTLGIEVTALSADIVVSANIVMDVAGEGVTINDCDNVSVTGNIIHECGDTGSVAESGIRVFVNASETAENITIGGNTIKLPTSDNAFRGISLYNDAATATIQNVAITGNSILGNGNATARGISINDTGGAGTVDLVTVVGNSLENFTIREILSRGTNVRISGNAADLYDVTYNDGVMLEGNGQEVVTTTNVITAAESGKTFYLNAAGGFTSTLPAPAIGLKYKFIVSTYKFIVSTAPTTAYIITTNAGANILQGTYLDIVGELVAISAQDTLNFVANTALVGDSLEVESDGTNWYCSECDVMADKKITDFSAVTSVADADLLYVVDVSDTTDSAAGTSKKVTVGNVRESTALYYGITAAETAAAVTPIAYQYEPGNVLRYGDNTSPGVTDMQPAIQAAIDVASQNGGEVYIPAGTYLLTASTVANGTTYHLSIAADNVSVRGDGRATQINTVTPNAAVFLTHGASKPDGVANWGSYQARDEDDTTVYTMTGTPAKGATTLTLNTAAEAGNFAVGDLCLIRSGQTKAGNDQPDGEINEILTRDAGTGVLTFSRPLAKPYAQENFDAGSSGVSSVGGAGTACKFGVCNIEDRMLKGISITDLAIDSTASRHALVGGQIDGLNVSRVYAVVTGAGFMSMGCFRDAWLTDNVCHTRGSGSTTWHLPSDSCCVDVWMKNNVLSSERVNYVHAHEGASRVNILNNAIINTASASDENGISIRSRARDVVVDGNHVINAGNGAAIYVDDTCDGGGVIKNNIVAGTAFTEAVSVASPNWFVQHSPSGAGNVSFFGKASSGYVYGPVEVLSTWVYDDAQNQPLGTLPAYVYVTKVSIHVTEAFNSDGTDNITVGWDADTNGLTSAEDVSTTGVKTPTLNAITGYSHTERDLEAYYVNGGSEPTTGEALIVVEYYRTERRV
jgi:hypothetical protein